MTKTVADLDVDGVARRLDLPDRIVSWLHGIDRPLEPGLGGLVLSDDAEADHLLRRLDVEPVDGADTLAARPDPHVHPAWWWLLDRVYRHTLHTMGDPVPIEGFRAWPALPPQAGALGRHLYVWAYLALLPHARRYHAARGIPDKVSWESLSTLGTVMRGHRSVFGYSGVGGFSMWSPPLRLRGAYYKIGRLEFNRGLVSLPNGPRGHSLGVHIPPGTPLDPAACDASFAAAREFFPRHFPDEPITCFTCSSWLMDPQLAEVLPADSRIAAFQRRFHHLLPLAPEGPDRSRADDVVLGYVFGRDHDKPDIPPKLLDELPQKTALQRAYVAHLRSGGHWYSRTGWIPF